MTSSSIRERAPRLRGGTPRDWFSRAQIDWLFIELARAGGRFADGCLDRIHDPERREIVRTILLSAVAGATIGATLGAATGPQGAPVAAMIGAGVGVVASTVAILVTRRPPDREAIEVVTATTT
jgi:hypothetical protein